MHFPSVALLMSTCSEILTLGFRVEGLRFRVQRIAWLQGFSRLLDAFGHILVSCMVYKGLS